MGAIHCGTGLVAADVGQQIEQGRFECGGVIYSEGAGRVVDDSVGRAFAVSLFDKQTVGRQLVDM